MVISGKQLVIHELIRLKGNAQGSLYSMNGENIVSFRRDRFVELMDRLVNALISDELE